MLTGPNPAHGTFAFVTRGPKRYLGTLAIYDVAGRVVDVVQQPMGTPLVWDGRTSAGRIAQGGIYFYRASANGIERTGHVVLLR